MDNAPYDLCGSGNLANEQALHLAVHTARYVGGCHPKKFCKVVQASPDGLMCGRNVSWDLDELNEVNGVAK